MILIQKSLYKVHHTQLQKNRLATSKVQVTGQNNINYGYLHQELQKLRRKL